MIAWSRVVTTIMLLTSQYMYKSFIISAYFNVVYCYAYNCVLTNILPE